ncbi:penicillin-binding transpeptidase domain-containing protein [Streptomyces sp. ZAF1911]|uniref:penicillin-binding transpeptidase domain-containing protein n=1 Tax=Streptomyces sp. ZAF1911 TaxID=2944129 RepID=UPI00237B7D5C|nr:penicillin-binding transpeptidase domain-containing protein [Streptomyces sp. ZAF1911]MDD9382584.1 penicillin-binding transpeptidase domain-containing protein [Streptomyces sp. ZAF1911]
MNGAAKGAVVGGAFLAMLGGAVYGVYALVGDAGDGDAKSTSATGPAVPAKGTGPVSDKDAAATAQAFFTAWAAGDARAGADLTNNPAEAQGALGEFTTKAYVSKVAITPGVQTGTTVAYSVAAEVTYEGVTKPLAYESKLTVVRGNTTGLPLVDWQPSVLHPQLQKGEKLRGGAPANPPVKAVDRKGRELTAEKYPSLRPVLDSLRKTYGERQGGTSGAELWIEPVAQEAPRRTLLTLVEGKPGEIETVLDADVQAAAEQAVLKFPQASVVAVQPSSGNILAVADHRGDGFPASLSGARAPGSTMKIVTGAMLLDRGLVAADKVAECPAEVQWGGKTFKNLKGFKLDGETFATSFAQSCNTAFIKQIKPVDDDDALSKEAREVFGIGAGVEWKVGVPTVDGKVPDATGPAAAAAYIGQGQIQMNPLTMASVTATARTGVFRQPVIVKASLDGREIAQAARKMKPSVAAQLVRMMKLTATSGTAQGAMSAVHGSDKGAKTGSAEVDGAQNPDSWFTGFSGDVAAAAMVEGGGHGGDAAGPIVAAVLNAG